MKRWRLMPTSTYEPVGGVYQYALWCFGPLIWRNTHQYFWATSIQKAKPLAERYIATLRPAEKVLEWEQ